MGKTFRRFEPDQLFLLPPSLTDWLPEDHQVFFLRDVLDTIDLTPITSVYEEEERGYPPYHPKMMIGLLFYGYTNGIFSSRKLARHCLEDVSFRVLTANNQPDFRTISEFRRRHLDALEHLYVEILRLCEEAGIVKYGHISLDGTKIKANASKHKAMSYGWMKTDIKRLKREIARLLVDAEKTDAREDRKYGPDKRGDELPAELALRETRLTKLRAAKWALEEEARQEAQQEKAKKRNKSKEPPTGPPMAKIKTEKGLTQDKPRVADSAQRNFTDP
jgi:transposase